MDKEVMEQFQLLAGMMEKMSSAMLNKDDIEEISDRSANKAAALVEDRLGKRVDSLVDGYKLTHEKQYELERKTEALQAEVEDLKSRLAALESRIA